MVAELPQVGQCCSSCLKRGVNNVIQSYQLNFSEVILMCPDISVSI